MANERNIRRLLVSGILIAGLAALGLTSGATAASAATTAPAAKANPAPLTFSGSTPNGAYRVTAVKLPAGARAVGSVTGPSHYKKTLALTSRPQVFLALPGKYTLTAEKVVISSSDGIDATPGTYFPVTTTIKFTVKKHQVASVLPNYDNIVAANVSVAPASALTPFTPPAEKSDQYTVGIAATYPEGAIIASGISKDAPYGLLVKVDTVGDTSDGVTSYTVENARLEDAVPRGAYSQTVSNPVSLSSSNPGSASPTSRTAKAIDSLREQTASTAPPYLKDLDCKGPSATLHLGANLKGDIKTEFSANWDVFNSANDSVTLSSSASLTDELDASITGKASCNLDKVELLAEPIELGTIEFLIGPVPVVINNTMNFTLAGSANVQAKLEEGITASVTTSSSATMSPAGITGKYVPPTPKVKVTPPTLSLKGEAQFYLGARLNMLLYDVAGPFVEAEIGPDLTVDTQANPWWNAQLELKVGAGLRADFFGLKPIEDDHILEAIFPIANSNTFGTPKPPKSLPGQPGSPGNPWYPAPTDPPTAPTTPGDPGATDTSPVVDLDGTGLQMCVNDWLNQPENTPVTENELASLTQLNCIYDPVTNIDALQYATNLQSLTLSPENNSPGTYADVSALSGLTKLTYLDVSNNSALTNVAPLASLTNLTYLNFNDDPNVDLSDIIALLPNLQTLNIQQTQLSDPAYLARLHHLKSLDLINTTVTSSEMTVISHLDLTNLSVGGSGTVADLQDIGSMKDLTQLFVFDDPDATDASFLNGLTKLKSLDLYRDAFTNLSALSTLPALDNVDVGGQYVQLPKNATVGEAYDLPTLRNPNGTVVPSGDVTAQPGDSGGSFSGDTVTFTNYIGYNDWSQSGTLPSGASWTFSGDEIAPNGNFSNPN